MPITISLFYRDRGVFAALEADVVPALAEAARASGRDGLSAWSAGCASGEEAHTLALIWREAVAARFPHLRLNIAGHGHPSGDGAACPRRELSPEQPERALGRLARTLRFCFQVLVVKRGLLEHFDRAGHYRSV